jgi:hypothetical protein
MSLRFDLWYHLAELLVVNTVAKSVSKVLEAPLEAVGSCFFADLFERLALVFGIGDRTPANVFAERAVLQGDPYRARGTERDTASVDFALNG